VRTPAELALGSLGDHGGAAPTVSLLHGSAALDAGDDAVCMAPVGPPGFGAGGLDQRGVPRPQGLHCDVGAYERIAGFWAYLPVIRK
jgi:hypothetical protein